MPSMLLIDDILDTSYYAILCYINKNRLCSKLGINQQSDKYSDNTNNTKYAVN